MREVKITADSENQRLDKFLMKYLNKAPKSFIYKMLRKKNIKLNGTRAKGNEILKEGDGVALFLSDDLIESLREQAEVKAASKTELGFDIVYEDKDIIIADKPRGLLTQADKKGGDCLNSRLISYLKGKDELRSDFVPSVCNRLDRNTGGLVTFAKTLKGAQELNRAFKEHIVDKEYVTVVKGVMTEEKKIKAWHSRSETIAEISLSTRPEGRQTLTEIKPVTNNGRYTLVKVKLITGKTHQIRALFKALGYPVAGDKKYGDKDANLYFRRKYGLENQFLYCCRMEIKSGKDFKTLKNMVVSVKGDDLIKTLIKNEFSVDFDEIM